MGGGHDSDGQEHEQDGVRERESYARRKLV